MQKFNFNDRAVHKPIEGCETGGFSPLQTKLSKLGYEYQYEEVRDYFETGIAYFKNDKGEIATLIRIEKGAPPQHFKRPSPDSVCWMSYRSQQPDTWQLIMKEIKPDEPI